MTAFSFTAKRRGPKYPELYDKHYAPAAVHAINNTIELIQETTRAKLPNQFILRTASSRRLFERLVSIDPQDFASLKQQKIRGQVKLGASLSAQEGVRRFAPKFTRFQFGGVATSDSGIPFAIPTRTLRSTPTKTIRKDLYPKALGLLESRTIEGGERAGFIRTKRGKILIKGKRRTYAVDPRFHPNAPHGTHGAWQRRGRGKNSDTYKIWNYALSVRYPKRLTFQEDSKQIASTHMPARLKADLERRVTKALISGATR